jgi:hypothetical protein
MAKVFGRHLDRKAGIVAVRELVVLTRKAWELEDAMAEADDGVAWQPEEPDCDPGAPPVEVAGQPGASSPHLSRKTELQSCTGHRTVPSLGPTPSSSSPLLHLSPDASLQLRSERFIVE